MHALDNEEVILKLSVCNCLLNIKNNVESQILINTYQQLSIGDVSLTQLLPKEMIK